MISNETLRLAKKLWDYHHMHHVLEKADCILALGSHDLRVAERAAQLYLEGWAPIIIFSGGLGNFTKEMWRTGQPIPVKIFFSRNNCLHKKISTLNHLLLCKNLTWKEEAMQHLKNIGLVKN